MNDVVFNKEKGGLGRPLAGEDHYSGLLYYVANGTALPASWGASNYLRINDLADLESKGVLASTALYKQLHYHVSEVFRINPNCVLYVGIAEEPAAGSIDFAELTALQNYADGKLRQTAIYVSGETFAAAQVTAIQVILTALATAHKPLHVLFTADISAIVDLTTLSDLKALTAPNVSVVIGQDGAGVGKALYDSEGVSISCIGAALGALSLAQVHENIGWPKKFNMSDGTELETPTIANDDLIKEQTQTLIDGIDTKGYIFLVKHIGLTGSYFNDTFTCVAATSDFAYIENNRAIDKAIRGIRTYLLPELNSPLYVDATSGKLSVDTAKYFERLAANAIEQMARNGEVSGFDVNVDPDQNVLTSSNLVISVAIVPVGVARTITVNIGFTVKIQS